MVSPETIRASRTSFESPERYRLSPHRPIVRYLLRCCAWAKKQNIWPQGSGPPGRTISVLARRSRQRCEHLYFWNNDISFAAHAREGANMTCVDPLSRMAWTPVDPVSFRRLSSLAGSSQFGHRL